VANPMKLDLRTAAERLGVHYMTAYRYVRLGRLAATHSGGRWWVEAADLDRLLASGAGDAKAAQPRRGSPRPRTYQRRLEDRLVAGDEPAAWTLVESALGAGMAPRSVILDVVAPALRSIGAGWESGRLSVTDEHRATAVAQRVVGQLGPRFARRGRTRGTVILAGAPGDPHSLPTALVADVLRGERYSVVDLGANTPTSSVVGAVAAASGGAMLLGVGLSLSDSGQESRVRRTARAVRRAAPEAPVFVGGPAVGSLAQARDLGGDDWAADAGEFADLLRGRRA